MRSPSSALSCSHTDASRSQTSSSTIPTTRRTRMLTLKSSTRFWETRTARTARETRVTRRREATRRATLRRASVRSSLLNSLKDGNRF